MLYVDSFPVLSIMFKEQKLPCLPLFLSDSLYLKHISTALQGRGGKKEK